jgi:CHASE3 domain sensor protein
MPIFWRLASGYLAILLLSAGISLHFIGELGALGTSARSALESDSRRVTLLEILTDAFLSEARYAGRFVISHTSELYDQYLQFNNDFARTLKALEALPQSAESQRRVTRIGELHLRYTDLFQREIAYLRSSQTYGESRYRQEKEKILESALRELELFRASAQKNLEAELAHIGTAASAARNRAFITMLALLGIGFGLCYAISRSITLPLVALQDAAASGAASTSPATALGAIPEIRALAETLRNARQQVHEVRRNHAAFLDEFSLEFTTRLLSLQNRLNAFQSSLGETASGEQNTALVVMIDEAERLIDACARVCPNAPAEATGPKAAPVLRASAKENERAL